MYNIKSRTGVNMSSDLILKLANDFKNIIGVKEASLDIVQSMEIISKRPNNFLVLSGDDQYTIPLISCGADGVISVTANVYPKEYSSMVKYAMNGDFEKARNIYYKLFELIELMFIDGNPAGVKAVLHVKNMITNQLRLPLSNVSRSTYMKIHDAVNKLDN